MEMLPRVSDTLTLQIKLASHHLPLSDIIQTQTKISIDTIKELGVLEEMGELEVERSILCVE